MEKINISFTKEQTAFIKGFAIIFMIVVHVFGGSGWYEPIYEIPMNHNEKLISFMGSFQICVGIFVFMIGYGYSFSDKSLLYSFRHIKRLLTVFWSILFCFALPAGYNAISSGKSLFLNMFGLEQSLTWVSWFVYLYIWAMIVMPCIGRMIDRFSYLCAILMAFFSWLSMALIYYCVPDFNSHQFWHPLFVCLGWTPTIILGYFLGKKKIFQKIKLPISRTVVICIPLFFVIILFLKVNYPGFKIINADIIYAPIIILLILILSSYKSFKSGIISKIIMELGDKSVYMWFFHAIFFTESTRHFYQKYVMISDNLLIIAFWTIILSYLISSCWKKIIEL